MQTDPEEDYARGWVPFLDCKIFLDSRPLIPRVETEYWVEKAIQEIEKRIENKEYRIKCLDLFAGSGAIGVAALKHLPNSHVDFGEIDTTHFPTIEKNIQENCVTRKLPYGNFLVTDVWSGISGAYGYIFANPPYLSEKRRERIQKSVLMHEPDRALFAKEDGFALIRKTIKGASAHLTPNGRLYIEHDPEQSTAIRELGKSHRFSVETQRDQFGVLRFSILRPMA